jgi:hypothetical protein
MRRDFSGCTTNNSEKSLHKQQTLGGRRKSVFQRCHIIVNIEFLTTIGEKNEAYKVKETMVSHRRKCFHQNLSLRKTRHCTTRQKL